MKLHESLTADRLLAAVENQMFGLENPGFCIACGNEQDGCEPDARHYECDACGQPQVFGAATILFLYIEHNRDPAIARWQGFVVSTQRHKGTRP